MVKFLRKIIEAICDFAQRYNEWEYEDYYQHERDRKKK
jgi:hypothetical protein